MKRIVANPAKCMACRACEIACAVAHAGTDDLVEALLDRGAKPRIYIEAAGTFAVPLQCRHCDDAPCARVCPSGALSGPDGDAPVQVNEKKCIGCTFCVEACPFGVIQISTGVSTDVTNGATAVIKCDLCASRQGDGLPPACVSSCPVGALSFQEVDDNAKKARAKAAAQAVELYR